jgi:arylsulfatase A-like enzyme
METPGKVELEMTEFDDENESSTTTIMQNSDVIHEDDGGDDDDMKALLPSRRRRGGIMSGENSGATTEYDNNDNNGRDNQNPFWTTRRKNICIRIVAIIAVVTLIVWAVIPDLRRGDEEKKASFSNQDHQTQNKERIKSKRKPNILIIHADQLNLRTIGAYRDRLPLDQGRDFWGPNSNIVPTPNIDWIAKEGITADRFYATIPHCTGSRGTFLTGLYSEYSGAHDNNAPLYDNVTTFAKVLKDSMGYQTAYSGKWHLNGRTTPEWEPSRKFGWTNNEFMFNRGQWKRIIMQRNGSLKMFSNDGDGTIYYDDDGDIITNRSNIPNYPQHVLSKEKEIWGGVFGAEMADETDYGTDFLVDRTIDFLSNYSSRRHNASTNVYPDEDEGASPFLYMLSIPDPHPSYTVRFPFNETYFYSNNSNATKVYRTPHNFDPKAANRSKVHFKQRVLSQYLGMVHCLDYNIGRILKTLQAGNLMNDTILIFTSDHGDLLYEHGFKGKGRFWDMSTRIPFILRIPPSFTEYQHRSSISSPSSSSTAGMEMTKAFLQPGSIVNKAFATLDFKATLLGLLSILSDDEDDYDSDAVVGSNHGKDVSSYFLSNVENQDNSSATSSSPALGDHSRIVFSYGASDGEKKHFPNFVGAFDSQYKLSIESEEYRHVVIDNDDDDDIAHQTIILALDNNRSRTIKSSFFFFDLQEDPMELANAYGNFSYYGSEIQRLALALQTFVNDTIISPKFRRFALPGTSKILQDCK